MMEITVNCSQSTPGVIRDCVIIGNGFFQLDKISFIDEIKQGTHNHHGSNYYTKYFNLVCDGVKFKIIHHTYDYNKGEKVPKHWIEVFEKFGHELIDYIFDDKTKQEKKYI